MIRYQLTEDKNLVLDMEHEPINMIVLSIEDNPCTQEYLEWLSAGNTPGSDIARQKFPQTIATVRYLVEQHGVVNYLDHQFPTDRESRNNIFNTISNMTDNDEIFWKTKNGDFIKVKKTNLEELGKSILTYVNLCFFKEKELVDYVNTTESLVDFDVKAEWEAFLSENSQSYNLDEYFLNHMNS